MSPVAVSGFTWGPPAAAHPGSPMVVTPVRGSLPSTWETRMAFPAPGVGLAQSVTVVDIWGGNQWTGNLSFCPLWSTCWVDEN